MVISELISRMEDVKARYGDCQVFVLSKSFYEAGTLIDAKDIVLTSFRVEKKNPKTMVTEVVPEVIVAISNCPVIANAEGTEEDAKDLLFGSDIRPVEMSDIPEPKRPRLFIGVESFILSYLLETGKYYVDYSDVDKFNSFIKQKVSDGAFSMYEGVTTDLNSDAFDRVVQCLPSIFDLAGNRLYVHSEDDLADYRCNYADTKESDPIISKLVSEFVQKEEVVK